VTPYKRTIKRDDDVLSLNFCGEIISLIEVDLI